MNKTISERLAFLKDSKTSHFNISEIILKRGGIAPMDIYALMVLKRSISLVFGFVELLEKKNFICAAPLIRLQIDNLLRFHAAFFVDNQSQFVVDILQGKDIRRMKDRNGNKMTDAYLQDRLEVYNPWLQNLYRHASGYVHLSEQHFFNTLRSSDGNRDGALDIYIGPDDKMVTDDVYEGAIEDMIRLTDSVLTFLGIWATKANNPPHNGGA
jgi:hypothetical protein